MELLWVHMKGIPGECLPPSSFPPPVPLLPRLLEECVLRIMAALVCQDPSDSRPPPPPRPPQISLLYCPQMCAHQLSSLAISLPSTSSWKEDARRSRCRALGSLESCLHPPEPLTNPDREGRGKGAEGTTWYPTPCTESLFHVSPSSQKLPRKDRHGHGGPRGTHGGMPIPQSSGATALALPRRTRCECHFLQAALPDYPHTYRFVLSSLQPFLVPVERKSAVLLEGLLWTEPIPRAYTFGPREISVCPWPLGGGGRVQGKVGASLLPSAPKKAALPSGTPRDQEMFSVYAIWEGGPWSHCGCEYLNPGFAH